MNGVTMDSRTGMEPGDCCARTRSGNGCIVTNSGIWFDLFEPDPATVKVLDIAHHLSHIYRFGGAPATGITVAEHSMLVHDMIEEDYGVGPLAYAGLMHDATEAYIGDMVRPLKARMPLFRELEDKLFPVICQACGVEWDDEVADLIKIYDNISVRAEAYRLMPDKGEGWNWGEVPLEMDLVRKIAPLSPSAARLAFLSRARLYRTS